MWLSVNGMSLRLQMPVERSESGTPGFRDYARNDEVEDPTRCGQYRDVTLRTHPCHTAHPLSCCAQSQHPERPAERSESGVPGFRDYARNDKVEDPTLCGQYRDVTLHPLSCCAPPLSCCAQSQHPERPAERSESGVPGFRDYARNDKVEDPTLPEVPGLRDWRTE